MGGGSESVVASIVQQLPLLHGGRVLVLCSENMNSDRGEWLGWDGWSRGWGGKMIGGGWSINYSAGKPLG